MIKLMEQNLIRNSGPFTIFLFAAATGCSSADEGPSPQTLRNDQISSPGRPNPSAVSRIAKEQVVDLQKLKLFKLAFGRSAPFVIAAPKETRDGFYSYRPAQLYSDGKLSILISEATASDCHGCFGKLAIHYFADQANQPKLFGAWLDLAEGNGWGKPPDWTLRTDLLDNPVIELRTSFGNNGYDCEWVSLIELTPQRPVVRLNPTVAAYDNTGAKDNSGLHDDNYWQSTNSVVAARDSSHFMITYEGDRKGVVTYSKRNGHYIADGPPPIEACKSSD